MSEILVWPTAVLTPQRSPFDQRSFSRTGGRSLGGVERTTRSDRGYWIGQYADIAIRPGRPAQRRTWSAVRTALGGRAGLIAVPVCSTALLSTAGFRRFAAVETLHSDDAPFDDDTPYLQSVASIEAEEDAVLGASSILMRLINAPAGASGIRFSYQHALYETGRIIDEPGEGLVEVSIFPTIRQAIPARSTLEVERPTCLCHLASDTEMDIVFGASNAGRATVNFVEAVDYWNDLALENA